MYDNTILLLAIHGLRRDSSVLRQGTFHSQTLGTRISKTTAFGSTLNTAVGTDTVTDVLLVERKGSGTLEAQASSTFAAQHFRRLESVGADHARQLAALLVGFVGGAAATQGRFVEIQAAFRCEAKAIALGLA